MRAVISLLLGLAVGMGLLFPAEHGCRSEAVSQQAVGGHEGHGGGDHRSPSSPAGSECSCVGDACGVTLVAPRAAPVLAVAPLSLTAAAPVHLAVDRPVVVDPYVLPFANGPPAFPQA